MDLIARLRLHDDFSSRLQKVTSNMSRTENAANKMTSSVKRFGSAVGSISAAIGLTAAVSAGFNMIKTSINSAFSRIDTMESFERTMTVLTGSADKTAAALEATREAVTGTAYGLDVAAKGVQDFVTRGMDIEKATKTVSAWGDAVAFYGKGSNEQLETVSDALAKMYSSGKVGMDQMNRLYDVGIDGVGMYAKAVGRDAKTVQKELSNGRISASEFIGVVSTAMMEGTNGVQKIAGAAKEAGASWGASFDNMRAAVTRGVVDIIQEIDRLLVENGLPDMRTMIANVGRTFEKNLKRVAGAIEPVVNAMRRVYKVFKPVVPIIKAVATALLIAAAAVGAYFGAIALFNTIGAAIMLMFSPIGLVIGALAGVGLAFYALYKHSKPFQEFVSKLIGGVKAFFKILNGDYFKARDIMTDAGFSDKQIQKLTNFAQDVRLKLKEVERAFSVFKGIGKYMKGQYFDGNKLLEDAGFSEDTVDRVRRFTVNLKKTLEKVGDAFNNVTVKDIASALGITPEVISRVGGFLSAIRDGFSEVVEYLSSKFEEVRPVFGEIVGVFSNLGEFLESVFTTVLNAVQPVIGGIVSAFKIIADVAVLVFRNIVAPAIAFVWKAIQVMWKIVGPILELLGAAIELSFNVLKVVWENIVKPFVTYLTEDFKSAVERAMPIIDGIGTAFDKVGGFISTVTGYVKDFASSISKVKIPEWVNTVGGKLAGAGQAVNNFLGIGGDQPKSRYHGLKSVPYDGYLARLHRGERVLTKQEADTLDSRYTYDDLMRGGDTYNSTTYNNVTNTQNGRSSGGGVTIAKLAEQIIVREEADIDRLAAQLAHEIILAGEGGA